MKGLVRSGKTEPGKEKESMKRIRKAVWKMTKITGISAILFFVISFTVYFFNLDMKLTAAIEPYLEKWHDKVNRERKL